MHPVIILLLLVGGYFFFRWCKRQPPEIRTKVIIYAAIAVILMLVVTGRMHWLLGVIGTGIALFQRLMMATQILNRFKSMGSPTTGKSSRIETRFLEMTLDHDSGDLSGVVLSGRFSGRALAQLDVTALFELLEDCRNEDYQSAAVLESYLQQRLGEQWKGYTSSEKQDNYSSLQSNMTREEALQILGVALNASKEEIVRAHRHLMQRLHPDRGGSTYLAAKINQAKDLLLDT